MAARKGKFSIRNKKKYVGDPNNIVYRSLWEAKFMRYLDSHPSIIKWASEEIAIPYESPLDSRIHRYYPDFWVKKRGKDGKIEVHVIEVKPKAQTKPPLRGRKKEATFLYEMQTWLVNERKWLAAEKFCQEHGWTFQIMTEDELYGKKVQ